VGVRDRLGGDGAGTALAVRLAHVKVAGLLAGLLSSGVLRGALLWIIRHATAKQPAIHVDDDSLRVNLKELDQSLGAPLQINLTRVASGDRPHNLLRWDLELGPEMNGEKAQAIQYEFKLELDRQMAIGTFESKSR
jgi:hypothetical protein